MPFLTSTGSKTPNALAFEDLQGPLSYADLSEKVDEAARKLRALGAGPGKAIALPGVVSREGLVGLHGIWKAGASAAPLNERWTESEKAIGLEALSPFLILEGPDLLSRLSEVPPSTGSLPPPDGRKEAVRLLTSGTSGRPGVVGLSYANLWASAEGSAARLDLHPTDRWLASLSPAHVGGIALITRTALTGACLVGRGPFSVSEFIRLLETDSITHASLVPTMLRQTLAAWGGRPAPESLRCLLIGGAPASDNLVDSATALGFPIALTYGLTEAASQVATAPPALVRKKPGTVGLPLPGLEVRVAENQELLVRGSMVALGRTDVDGWLRTGDLAREDGDGHLWIMGRLSDRIISGGVNVDPTEVERVLESHSEVTAAVVVGIPDPEWGERVVAAVTGTMGGSVPTAELDHLSRSNLSSAKRPRAFRVLDSIPRNTNGKVNREAVRALFQ
ncbi:MAG: AMP-binding protein [Gemmatimonadetes bacterium]|nr:AMP-binding protein [Gemmatimonadota bacterium]NNM04244.1 AMP-binding protein [Gemmatimonadota bacterium]